MNQSSTTTNSGGSTLTDALIGAAAGAVGVFVLDRLDWFMWRREDPETRAQTTAVRPGGEPPAHVLAGKIEKALGAESPDSAEVATKLENLETEGLLGNRHFVAGNVVHYGVGVGPAALYSVFQDKLPLPGPARGALYGLSVFLTQDEGLNAISNLGAKPQQYPWQGHARGLITHLVYGIVTDAVISFLKEQTRSSQDQETRSSDRSKSAASKQPDSGYIPGNTTRDSMLASVASTH